MSYWDFVRLRGTIVAVSTFFTIVALYVVIDRVPPPVLASEQPAETTTRPGTTATTIPVDNRLCGLAQRLLIALPHDEPGVARAMQGFYTEAASFTDGDVHGEFVAAARFYKEVNDIATKADWDIERIVRANDGPRWKALLTGLPTGVEESRNDILLRCRANLPATPAIEVDRAGRISDPLLARLLAPIDKEIFRPAAPPEPESEPTNEAPPQ